MEQSRKPQEFPKLVGAIFGSIWASPGPGVAVDGRASSRSTVFPNSRRNPGSGEVFRGHFSFLKNTDIRNVMRQGKHTTRQPLANLVREILVMGIGCIKGTESFVHIRALGAFFVAA